MFVGLGSAAGLGADGLADATAATDAAAFRLAVVLCKQGLCARGIHSNKPGVCSPRRPTDAVARWPDGVDLRIYLLRLPPTFKQVND